MQDTYSVPFIEDVILIADEAIPTLGVSKWRIQIIYMS